MRFDLSAHAKEMMVSRSILKNWIKATVEEPSVIIYIDECEAHYFRTIKENQNRCLKIVVNPTKSLIVTAFFDRKMRKKGCR